MKHLIKRDLRPAQPDTQTGRDPGQTTKPDTVQEQPPVRWQESTRRRAPLRGEQKTCSAESSPRPVGARTCLVVDDSRMIRKVARRIVSGLGFTVHEAENGEEALALCRKAIPDLVLTDWDMPVMTGLDFVASLRILPGANRAKVIFCTSKSSVHDIHDGIAAGADEYVIKPFDELKLRRKLEELGFA